MIEIDLVQHLLADSDVTDLVGNRIEQQVAPQGTEKPFIVISVPNNKELQALNSRIPYGQRALVQIDCWSETFSGAVAVRNVVQTSMHSYKTKAYNLYTMPDYEPETKLFRQIIQFNI